MERGAIVDAITRIPGTWSPGPGAGGADLTAARNALFGLLAAETHPDDVRAALATRAAVGAVEGGVRAAIERLVDQLPTATAPDQRVLIRRGSELDPAAHASVAGIRVSR